MNMSEQINELAAALSKAQAEFPEIKKNKKVNAGKYSYNYAELATIIKLINPILSKHDLSIVQPLCKEGIETILMHSSGQWIKSFHALPDPNRAKAQEFGSAITYARRYSYGAMVGVATEDDDDGRAAHNSKPVKSNMKNTVAKNQSRNGNMIQDEMTVLKKNLINKMNEKGIEQDSMKEFVFLTVGKENSSELNKDCLLYTSPSPRDRQKSRMPSSA